jgi:hypothetical protein
MARRPRRNHTQASKRKWLWPPSEAKRRWLSGSSVGFSYIDALHNAAHHTRHSKAFPCH